MASMTTAANAKPRTGETTIGTMTLFTTPDHCTPLPAASAAPTRPPIRPCDDDEGSPSRQVIRFHTIAPTSAASTTASPLVPRGASITPPPTVEATSVPRNAPTKFIAAAIPSATGGVNARVATEVAMALAASWKPFVQSKANATTITSTIPASSTVRTR
jgi:hypothetical protein